MPDVKNLSWNFIKQIIQGEKKFLKIPPDLELVEPPKFKMFLNGETWKSLKKLKEFTDIIPDKYIASTPPKNYFWKCFQILRQTEF